MMNKTRISLAGLSLLAAMLALRCGGGEVPSSEPEKSMEASSEQEVRDFVREWVTAWARRDIPGIQACYAESFLLMPSGQESLQDAGSLEQFLQQVTAGDRFSFTYRSQAIRVQGDLAVERGSYVLSFLEGEGRVRTDSGNLMRILERGPDANWRISSEIWNVTIRTGSP